MFISPEMVASKSNRINNDLIMNSNISDKRRTCK